MPFCTKRSSFLSWAPRRRATPGRAQHFRPRSVRRLILSIVSSHEMICRSLLEIVSRSLAISASRVNRCGRSMRGNRFQNEAVTIRDVARAAGVSLSSVSRALNGGKNVSARVARDVAAAARHAGLPARLPGAQPAHALHRHGRLPGFGRLQSAQRHHRAGGGSAPARCRLSADRRQYGERPGARARGRQRSSGAGGSTACWWRLAATPTARLWRDLVAAGTPVVILDRDPLEERRRSVARRPSWSITAPARWRRPAIWSGWAIGASRC